jgi:hypothetical protein
MEKPGVFARTLPGRICVVIERRSARGGASHHRNEPPEPRPNPTF